MIVDTALRDMQQRGTPIRVGIVGAGATGRAIALQLGTPAPGIRLAAIANRTIANGERALREAGVTEWALVDSAAAAESAITGGRTVLTQDPPRPRSIEASIPESLEMVIQKAMSKSPQERYQNMAELEADLAPWDPGEGDAPTISTPGNLDQAAAARRSTSFDPKTWTAFVSAEIATAIPGAVEFARAADAKGVKVFYVSNRTAEEEAPTRRNLERLGFPMDAIEPVSMSRI